MARLLLTAVVAFFFVTQLAFADDSPAPAPAPELGADWSPQNAPSPTSDSPANSPLASSPPAPVAPSPSDPVTVTTPEKSPASTPAPSPSKASNINHSNMDAGGEGAASGGKGGMSGRKKAGIALGVILAAVVVGLAGLIFKKRQENIRRSQYSYAVRREIL